MINLARLTRSRRIFSSMPCAAIYPLRLVLETDRILAFKDLQALCPSATGAVFFPCSSGEWVRATIPGSVGIAVPQGPLLCVLHGGVNLGLGFGLAGGSDTPESDQPIPEMNHEAVEAVTCAWKAEGGGNERDESLVGVPYHLYCISAADSLPVGHWCEVEVTNPENGKKMLSVALVDTGSSMSCFPGAVASLGVLSGGEKNIAMHSETAFAHRGLVDVRPIRLAQPLPLHDESCNAYAYAPLPGPLESVRDSPPLRQITNLNGKVAVIGLPTLAAWGICVHPRLGIVQCTNLQ